MRRRRADREGQYRSAAYRDLQDRLSASLKRQRKRRSWSQEEAAHRCAMATQLFQRIEAGDTNVTLTSLARLCEGFGVDVRRLFQAPTPRATRRPGIGKGEPAR